MGKSIKSLSRCTIEKILTDLTGKTGLPLVFIDSEGHRIMGAGASDLSQETAEKISSFSKTPVIVNGELAGNIFTSARVENQEPLLNMAAYCIENSFRLEEEIEDLSAEIVNLYQELSLIYSLSSKLGSELDIRAICEQVIDEISNALEVKTIIIMLLNEKTGMLSVQTCTGLEMEAIVNIKVDASTEPFARIFSKKEAMVITDEAATNPLPFPLKTSLCVPLVTDNRNIGLLIVSDKMSGKEFRTPEIKLIDALSGEIASAIKKAQLYERINRLFISTVDALASAIDAKDPYTYGHSRRVAQISSDICREIGMSSDEINSTKLAALLHDIGKIGTPEHILQKPGRLQLGEIEKIKEHPLQGAQILSTIDELKDVVDWIKHHHERYDGKGYPDCKAAEDIPLQSRIISIADSYDAMTSDRPYRKGMDPTKVLDIMNDLTGSQYDPELFRAFKAVFIQNRFDGS